MRITFDTNVLVSAFISKRGHPAAILDMALTLPDIELVLSDPILDEFTDVLSRPEVLKRFDYSRDDIEKFVKAIQDTSTIVRPTSSSKIVNEDPDDDIVINTAYDGKSEYIVTGDHHLQELGKFRRVRIVSPKAMLDIIARRFGRIVADEP